MTPKDDPRPIKPDDTGFSPIDSDNRKEYRKDLAAWKRRNPDQADVETDGAED